MAMKEYLFEDILTIVNGKNQKAVESANGKYPICGSGGIMGFATEYLCPANTVILGRKGSINNPIYMDVPFWNVDTAFGLVANRKVLCPKYLYYFCLHYDFERHNKAVTIPSLTKSDLLRIRIALPDVNQQERIASELDLITNLKSLYDQQLRELDLLEKSIFYDSFGNPVNNPIGWKTLSLSDVSSLITDGSHYSPKDEEMGTIPMLSVKNMGARGFDYTDCKMISQEEFKKLEAAGCKPMPDDVLVAKDGSYFKKIFVHQSEASQAILSSIAIIRPDQTKVTPEFLCSLLSTPDIYNLVEERYLTGTAIKRVILKGLRQLKIIVPPMDMQKQFSMKIWRINAQRRLIEESVVEAQKLFDSRMNYYFGD